MYRRRRKKRTLKHLWLIFALVLGFLVTIQSSGFIFSIKDGLGSKFGSSLDLDVKDLRQTASDKVGRVLGERGLEDFNFRISNFKLEEEEDKQKVTLFKFAIVSDSHEDTIFFPQILERIRKEEANFLIHLGDLSNAGELAVLQEAKEILDASGLSYYVIPGDHDYNWHPNHDLANWRRIFKDQSYFSFDNNGIHFVLLDTSNNQDGVDVSQMVWLREDLELSAQVEGVFIFTHRPLYSSHFPDKVDANGFSILKTLADYEISQVFSGDVHSFSQYEDPEAGIGITTVGAAGRYKNPLPQYVLVTVYDDYSFWVEAKPYKKLQIERSSE